jgi:hypothetical protein
MVQIDTLLRRIAHDHLKHEIEILFRVHKQRGRDLIINPTVSFRPHQKNQRLQFRARLYRLATTPYYDFVYYYAIYRWGAKDA